MMLDLSSVKENQITLLPFWSSFTGYLLTPASITKLLHLLSGILTFENSLAPDFSELLQIYQPTQTLQSSNEKLLKVPKTDPKSVRNRSFHYQAAVVWNSLLRAVPAPCHYPRSKQISKLTCLKSTFLLMSKTHLSAVWSVCVCVFVCCEWVCVCVFVCVWMGGGAFSYMWWQMMTLFSLPLYWIFLTALKNYFIYEMLCFTLVHMYIFFSVKRFELAGIRTLRYRSAMYYHYYYYCRCMYVCLYMCVCVHVCVCVSVCMLMYV